LEIDMSYPTGPEQPQYGAPVPPANYAAPAPAYAQPGAPSMPPSKNIGWSIASLLLFWPLCIPSFIAGSKVSELWYAGRFQESMKASADAKKFGRIGVIIGGVVWVLYIVLSVVGIGLAATQN
jgi:hypothetical protein